MWDYPEPPRWLMILGTIVLAPFYLVFMILWGINELIRHGPFSNTGRGH